MEDLFLKEYECSVCNNEFSSSKLRRSHIKVKERDSDFCSIYEGENPTYYGVICCPNCGYAALEKDFSLVNEDQKTIIRRVITTNWSYQDFTGRRTTKDAIQVHLIALANYKIIKGKASTLGLLSLRIAWYYRFLGNKEKENKYLLDTEVFFERAFETEHAEDLPMKDIEIIYLIGDINRRLGNSNKAIHWYSKVTNHEKKHQYRLIVGRARQYWSEIAEAERKNREGEK